MKLLEIPGSIIFHILSYLDKYAYRIYLTRIQTDTYPNETERLYLNIVKTNYFSNFF